MIMDFVMTLFCVPVYLLCAGLVTRLTVLRFISGQFEWGEIELSTDSREITSLKHLYFKHSNICPNNLFCLFLYVITAVQHINSKGWN